MFSWVAIDRFAEKERARDGKFRKQSADKVLRSDAQPLTDDELLAKLRSFDIELDRHSLEGLCRRALSAEEIATPCSTNAPSAAGKRRWKATGSGSA